MLLRSTNVVSPVETAGATRHTAIAEAMTFYERTGMEMEGS